MKEIIAEKSFEIKNCWWCGSFFNIIITVICLQYSLFSIPIFKRLVILGTNGYRNPSRDGEFETRRRVRQYKRNIKKLYRIGKLFNESKN